MHSNSVSTAVNSFIQENLLDTISPMTKVILAVAAAALACLAIALTALYYGGFIGKKNTEEEPFPKLPVKPSALASASVEPTTLDDSQAHELIEQINQQKEQAKHITKDLFLQLAKTKGQEIYVFNLLCYNDLTGSDLLEVVKYCPNLVDIKIASTNIGTLGLLPLVKLKKLLRLDLTRCQISDAHLQAILFPTLKVLKLSGKHHDNHKFVTNATLAKIGAGAFTLEELHLDSFKFTAEGFKGLLPLVKLRKLDLQDCDGVTDKALEYFPELPELQELNLHGCKAITDAGREFLAFHKFKTS